MTKELLAQCGLASVISDKKMQIGIKPNLVSPSEASWGATTHPEIVAELLSICRKRIWKYCHSGRLLGGDKTTEAYEVCGYRELTEKYQVPFGICRKTRGLKEIAGG